MKFSLVYDKVRERTKTSCPFCGSSNISVFDKWQSKKGYWRKRVSYVFCHSCKARGPIVKSDREYDIRNERMSEEESGLLHEEAMFAWCGIFPHSAIKEEACLL